MATVRCDGPCYVLLCHPGHEATGEFNWALSVPMVCGCGAVIFHGVYLMRWYKNRFRIAPAASFFLHGVFHSALAVAGSFVARITAVHRLFLVISRVLSWS